MTTLKQRTILGLPIMIVLVGMLVAVVLIATLGILRPVAAAPDVPTFTAPPDPYALYDPQDTCDDTPKPGVEDFRSLVLAEYPGTGDSGIVRECGGSTSEHIEGRAWDWTVSASAQAEVADDLLNWLFETRDGHDHALIRRFGIMYIIWNGRIWSAERHEEGWRPYNGSNPHTDHMHFSFSWDGALKQTTWWTAQDSGDSGSLTIDLRTDCGDLALDSTGDCVRELQRLLNQWGVNPQLAVDGIFGELTKDAVQQFQRENDLDDDGIVGRKTKAALYGESDQEVEAQECDSGTPLSNTELVDVVLQHFPEGTVPQTSESIQVTAYAVARAESGGNPTACGDHDQAGNPMSFGLWQIHTGYHDYDRDCLVDAECNADAALQISGNGQDWNPWCTWESTACSGNGNQRYRQYLDEARTALSAL